VFTFGQNVVRRHIRIGLHQTLRLGPAKPRRGVSWSVAVLTRPYRLNNDLPKKRLAEEAKRLRTEAKLLPPGATRDETIRRARQAETGSRMSEWLRSPGLHPRSKAAPQAASVTCVP
jgi:hypothetical protein